MTKLWFKRKTFGYGWYPSTKEGWLVLLGFVMTMLLPSVLMVLLHEPISESAFIALFLPYTAVATGLLLWICVKKGE